MLWRQFIRRKSYYLSEKWTKEPFDIGYPVSTTQIQHDSKIIREKLFPAKELSEYDYFAKDPHREVNSDHWSQLDNDQTSKYQKLADENRPQYVHPKPKFVTGFDLFKIELMLQANQKKYWSSLSKEDKERYNNSKVNEYLHNEKIRIWQGYEIVEYLKRYLQTYMHNPYPLLGLYPWEIIKDKLRDKRVVYEFERDYYDTLIKETFGRNSQRRALQIYYTDAKYQLADEVLNYATVSRMFRDLPSHQKDYYLEKERKRQEHSKKVKNFPYKKSTAYLRYAKEFSRTYEPSGEELMSVDSKVSSKNIYKMAITKAAGREWRKLSEEEKQSYESNDMLSSNTRLYKEMILDWKVSMVMDYIYDVGGVTGLNEPYDWRADMHSKSNGYRYTNRMYVSSLTYIQKGNLMVTDGY